MLIISEDEDACDIFILLLMQSTLLHLIQRQAFARVCAVMKKVQTTTNDVATMDHLNLFRPCFERTMKEHNVFVWEAVDGVWKRLQPLCIN